MMDEMIIIKGLLNMLVSRIERLEKLVEGLTEQERVTSTKEFEENKAYFNKELNRLNKLI